MTMKSQRSKEGYFMLDHRASPGLPENIAHAVQPDLPVTFGRGLFEAPSLTCNHCEAMVVLNPDRQRERARCPKCSSYLCDRCGAAYQQTQQCMPFKAMIDEMQEKTALDQQAQRPIDVSGLIPDQLKGV